jgi:hypothetical protein
MRIRNVPRDRDEHLLEMLHMRCSGMTSGQIARRLGTSQQNVSEATGNVLAADLTESGEPPARVRLAYQWREKC